MSFYRNQLEDNKPFDKKINKINSIILQNFHDFLFSRTCLISKIRLMVCFLMNTHKYLCTYVPPKS